MKILINAGSYEIKQIAGDIALLEDCAKTCYQSSDDKKGLQGEEFIEWLIKRGHESVIEHSIITVKFNDISRGFTHEDVRHRLSSFSQESTRYTDPRKANGEFKVVMPEGKDLQKKYEINGQMISVEDWVTMNEQMYVALLEDKWAKQDARQILPIGVKSQLVHSANFREWRLILTQRTAGGAHWEIRRVMRNLLAELKTKIPVIFDDIGVNL